MPQAIDIGGFLLDVDRLLLAAAVLVALSLMHWLARRFQLEPDRVERIGIAILIASAVAGRVAFVVAQWPAYRDAPWTVLYFWRSGYSAAAAVVGGAFIAAAVFLVERVRRARPCVVPAVLGLAAPVALFAAIEIFPASLWASPGHVAAGDTVPSLRMENLAGDSVSLAQLRGHPVILNVWATWCPPCRREMPLLDRAYQRHRDDGLCVVGIDRGETRSRINAYLSSRGISYEVWVDPTTATTTAPSARLLDRVGSGGLPTTLFVDAGGIVRSVQVGELYPGILRQHLRRILDRKGARPADAVRAANPVDGKRADTGSRLECEARIPPAGRLGSESARWSP